MKMLQRFSPMRYITLSHRWPTAPILRLTHDNLGKLKAGVHVNELPITFQHAVHIADRLGPQYLCIVSKRNYVLVVHRLTRVWLGFTLHYTRLSE
jgi:hypothetical protein